MPSALQNILDSHLIISLQEAAGTVWSQLNSLINVLAASGPILDLAGVALCVVMVGYLIYNRVKYRQLLLDERLVSQFRSDFSAEVITRMIGQQTEKSFATLVRAIYNERERLQCWAEQSLLPAGETLFASGKHAKVVEADSNDTAGSQSTEDVYRQMSKLASSGKGSIEIAAVLKRPQAEVELCLSVERRRVVNGEDTGPENMSPRGKNFRLISGSRVDSRV